MKPEFQKLFNLFEDPVQGGQVHHQAPVGVAVAALTFLNCNTNNPGSLGTSSWRSSLPPPCRSSIHFLPVPFALTMVSSAGYDE